MPMIRVFVSSTWEDLQPERQAVEMALGRLSETKFIGMEHFGSREETPRETSLLQVDESDLYQGIVGGRYGSGITAAEYQRAQDRGLDCLIYKKRSCPCTETDPEKQARFQEFLNAVDRHTASWFTTPEDLALKITTDVHRWLVDKVLRPRLRDSGFVADLADSYLPPWPVFERLDLDRFTGRRWLAAAVDEFLSAHDRGYLVLEADAGLGKTAFLAHLVRERRWIHHFVELARGQDGIGPGLRNLAAQIVLTWEPEYGGSLADISRPDLLQSLLLSAAEQRDRTSPDEKIVLVVDGLDESAAFPGQNVMGLPRMLPPGVYLLVSQRPVQVILETDVPRTVVRLLSGDASNQADMRDFLERVAKGDEVSALLRESDIAPDDFISALLERSQGIWIYLHYVLEELERGERRPLDLETLPRGLWPYYAKHWQRRRAGADWAGVELPLLASLAAAQEELPAHLLCAFAGVSDTVLVERLLREEWRPFLATSAGDERRYRCYHASFREFLEGKVDRRHLTEWEQILADELAAATRTAHGRIADRFLEAWGGFDRALEGLNDPPRRDLDGGYGLRHVAAHLDAAGRLPDLTRLLRLESEKKNVWYAVHEKTKNLAGYLSDVIRAWRSANEASRAAIEHGKPAVTVVIEARCALLLSSVHSLASRVGPSLLVALVEKKVREPQHALTYAREIPEPTQRFWAMAHLILVLPEPHRGKALNEAVAVAKWCRREAFAELPPGLPRELLADLLRQELAAEPSRQNETLAALAPRLPGDLLAELLSTLRAAENARFSAELWAALVPLAPSAERDELIRRVREAAEQRKWWRTDRVKLLLLVADFLPDDERERLAQEALEITRAEPVRRDRILLLSRALPFLKKREQKAAVQEVLKTALVLHSFEVDGVLEELIPRLAPELLEMAEKRLLHSIRGSWNWEKYLPLFASRWEGRVERVEAALSRIERHYSRGKSLAALAPHLPDRLVERALQSALTIHGDDERKSALDGLAPRLSQRQLEKALESLLGVGVSSGIYSAQESLLDLVVRLSHGKPASKIKGADRIEIDDLAQAEADARTSRYPRHRAERLIHLAAAAPASERPRLLGEALKSIRRVRNHPHAEAELLAAAAFLQDGPERERLLAEALVRLWKWARTSSSREIPQRMLLAMVPHLTEPMLRSSLAWTGALAQESEMQAIFQELIPRLPEALIAEPLLLSPAGWKLLAHDSPSEGTQAGPPRAAGRTGALFSRLWTLIPRQRLFSAPAEKALLFLTSLMPAHIRARAFAGMALTHEKGSPDETSLPQKAFSIIERLPSPLARARLLTALIPRFSKHQTGSATGRALAAALAIPDPAARADALDALAPFLHPYFQTRLQRTVRNPASANEPTDDEALEELRESASAGALLRRLEHHAQEDREPLLAKARQIVEHLEIPELRGWTLLQLVPYLPADEGEKVVREWISNYHFSDTVSYLAQNWGRHGSPFGELVTRAVLEKVWGSDRSAFLTLGAPHLPDTVLPDALEKAWTIERYEERRVRVLKALAARWVSLPAADLHSLWREALRWIAVQERREASSEIEALLPVLEALGGEEAIQEALGF